MRNNKGFSLIELMVVMSIGTIMALAMASQMVQSLMVSQTADIKSNVNSLVTTTQPTLYTEPSCTDAMKGQKLDASLKLGLFDSGTKLVLYKLTIDKIYYENKKLISTDKNGSVYGGTVMIQLVPMVPIYGSSLAPRPLATVFIATDKNNVITKCGPTMPIVEKEKAKEENKEKDKKEKEKKEKDNELEKTCVNLGGNWNNGACKFSDHGSHK